jgi:streptomycin 6-kinase
MEQPSQQVPVKSQDQSAALAEVSRAIELNPSVPGVDVASRLSSCKRIWHLEGGSRLDGGFRSDVFGCTTAAGAEVVVKLADTQEQARTEAAALAMWEHTGATVRLIDADFEHSALILERVRPATHLPGGNDPAAIEVAADLLTRLHRARTAAFPFPALEETYGHLEDQARDNAAYERRTRNAPARGEAGLRRLGAARAAAMRLCATARQTVVLHGDFLDKNLLRNGAHYVAIDPIPRVGDPCTDVGFFAAGHRPATRILKRADAIAEQMSLDRHRAQRWAAVWTVLQTCHAWRDDQSDLETCLASSEFEQLLRVGEGGK